MLIAEVGCNHKGDMGTALRLIIEAKAAGATIVKFQKRNPKELLTEEEYNAPHPCPKNSYGKTYGEHREYLEFNLEQHAYLKEKCEEFGIIYSTSVWDLTSAKEITSLNPELIKIPSACNLKKDILEYLCDNFKGEIHLSLGMTYLEEEEEIVKFFESKNRNKDLIIYACTSGYPVDFKDICMLELKRLKETFEGRVKGFGFSGHHIGIDPDILAIPLGASYIERHFTLNKKWKGTDHIASLEPKELKRLAELIQVSGKVLEFKTSEILPVEEIQRNKLKRF